MRRCVRSADAARVRYAQRQRVQRSAHACCRQRARRGAAAVALRFIAAQRRVMPAKPPVDT